MEYVLIATIALLLAHTLINKFERSQFAKRNLADWLLDGASLAMHFFIMPALQVVVLFKLFAFLFPAAKSSLSLTWPLALAYYAFVDYLWYWNHRIFHFDTPLWRYHAVHHAPEYLDVLKTPRNSLLSHFMMVYWWFIGLGVFIAKDPTALITIASVGSMINFWGHSKIDFAENSKVGKLLGSFLIMPKDHHYHHSKEYTRCNFGTVFSLWDRFHGTLVRTGTFPKGYGFKVEKKVFGQLFLP